MVYDNRCERRLRTYTLNQHRYDHCWLIQNA